jgi:hypothetical protein
MHYERVAAYLQIYAQGTCPESCHKGQLRSCASDAGLTSNNDGFRHITQGP